MFIYDYMLYLSYFHCSSFFNFVVYFITSIPLKYVSVDKMNCVFKKCFSYNSAQFSSSFLDLQLFLKLT